MILIVDDSEDIRELVKRVLNKDGFMPAVAANGEDAIEMIKSGSVQPSLIFLDSKMDIMDGQEFLNQLESFCGEKPVKVVVMSGSDRPLSSRLIIDSMSKPLDLALIKYYANQHGTRKGSESEAWKGKE